MPSERATIRFLLDEHYPGWLAEELTADRIDAVALIAHRPELRGASDAGVLEGAAAERRVVVTEDVSTFSVAIARAPDRIGVVYCHHARFPHTRPGLGNCERPSWRWPHSSPPGLGEHPVVWWLASSQD